MTDIPTREQVQKALDWQERGDQPDRLIDGINPILIIQAAARLWLEETTLQYVKDGVDVWKTNNRDTTSNYGGGTEDD